MVKRFLNNKKLRNDILLAAVIVILAVAGFLTASALKSEGSFVSVKIDGKEEYRYPLGEDVRKIISTGNGDENVLVIKNGEAFIESANCKDKICVEHRKIKNTGESIVCLPHKVVIEIVGSDSTSQADVVV